MFATYMFNGLHIDWASSLLGFIAVALIPVPVYFYFQGAKLRARSTFAPTLPKMAAVGGTSDEEKGE